MTTDRSNSSNPAQERPVGYGLVRRNYGPRVLGEGLAALCLGAALVQMGAPEWALVAVGANGLIWPHLAYRIARQSRQPAAAEHRNLLMDSAFGGFWVAAIGFNLLPSVLVLMMLAMDNVACGGLRLLCRGLLAKAAGIAIGLAMVGFRLELASSLPTLIACVPFLVVYPLTVGWITHRLANQLSRKSKELEWLVRRDPVSGVFGRAYFDRRLEEEFALARRSGREATLVMADIDHFGRINEQHGHVAGNDVLNAAGLLLRDAVRPEDVVARFSGDAFAILLADSTPADALMLVERVRLALAAFSATQAAMAPAPLTMSFGIAALDARLLGPNQWVDAAEAALQRMKRSGRNQAAIHRPGDTAAVVIEDRRP